MDIIKHDKITNKLIIYNKINIPNVFKFDVGWGAIVFALIVFLIVLLRKIG